MAQIFDSYIQVEDAYLNAEYLEPKHAEFEQAQRDKVLNRANANELTDKINEQVMLAY